MQNICYHLDFALNWDSNKYSFNYQVNKIFFLDQVFTLLNIDLLSIFVVNNCLHVFTLLSSSHTWLDFITWRKFDLFQKIKAMISSSFIDTILWFQYFYVTNHWRAHKTIKILFVLYSLVMACIDFCHSYNSKFACIDYKVLVCRSMHLWLIMKTMVLKVKIYIHSNKYIPRNQNKITW